jgi:iron complex outermembrane recepter protein
MSDHTRFCKFPRPAKRQALRAVALGTLALMAVSSGAMAQTAPAQASPVATPQRYALEAGPLSQTLAKIATLSGRPVAFDEALVSGLKAGPVTGSLSARQAVEQALAGTGLQVSESATGSLQVGASDLGVVVILAKRDQAETSFKADRSDTATRSGTDLLDVPTSMTIITSKVLETQQSTSIDEALRNVSGLVTRENAQGLSTFAVRGFVQTSALVNGVSSPYASMVDVNGVERIEVLKGPQAILSGGDSLGGAVNIVTKKPQAETVRELLLQYGSYGDKTVGLDVGGALGYEQRLSYRVIGSWADASHNDAGFDGREKRALMPQLRWKDAQTDFIVGASIDKQHTPQNRYTFAMDGIQSEPTMLLGNKDDGFDLDSKRLFYSLERNLAPSVTLVSRMQRSLDTIDVHVYGVQFPTSNTSFGFVPTNDVTDYNTTSGDHYLRLSFDTGPLSHKLSTGLNHTQQTVWRDSYAGDLQMVDAYASSPYEFPALNHDSRTQTYSASSKQRGLFAQDLIEFGDFNLLLSARNTKYENGPSRTSYLSYGTVSNTAGSSMSKTTPGVGLVYKLQPNVSLYASYIEGFVPQFSTSKNCNGGAFDPIETKNKEIGAKFDLLDHRLAVTVSAFELNQSNRLEYEQVYGDVTQCYRQRDAAQIRGLELDVQGQIARGWNVVMNYTYNHEKDVEKESAVEAAKPKNAFSLWTTYEFQHAALKGLGMGLGVKGHSQSRSDYTSTAVMIPGSATVDASVFYTVGRWSATLGIKNLFDRTLYGYATSPLYVPIESGRTAMFTLRTRFD